MVVQMPAEAATALRIDHLVKSYGAVDVLRDITLDMKPGEFLVLVGPSGCGKSTLLNCIAGLEEVTSGSIEIAGRDVTWTPPRDRDIAMVFQSYALYPTMSVMDNIGFGMKVRRQPKEAIRKKVGEVAELLQIDHLLDRRPSQLSGGQRQRVAMGRALVREPELFLFDEPLSNLDAKLRVEMRAEIKRLHKTTGASIVYVTHDQIEAMTLASRIAVLKDGILQQFGTPDEIYERPANTFVADFMGSPPMNLVPAKVIGSDELQLGPEAILHVPGLAARTNGIDMVIAGIRPEHMGFVGDSRSGVEIRPEMIEHTGSDSYVSFRLGEKMVIARTPGKFAGEPGLPVRLFIEADTLSFFDPAGGHRIEAR
ncbi:ABC transporter ATP-binding protein [Cucumibacter marinus]|uniref:ABC transporter ATP-binding protein n=1 Tax=Cucumibacter marinus TaxID=1121252 RepID=UPI0009DC0033|nr:ABC transporter ATP-binding protein [Cucumibacter marinus]